MDDLDNAPDSRDTPKNLQYVFFPNIYFQEKKDGKTRGPKGYISCTWVKCATFLTDRLGRPFLFINRSEKHKLCWDLASWRVSLNSVHQFQKRSRKCLSQSKAGAVILLFSEWPEKHKLGRGCWDLASSQFSLNSVQWSKRKRRKCLSQSHARAAILFFRLVRKHKLGRGCWDLASCQVSLNSVHRFQRRSRKCLSKSRPGAAILFFRSARKTPTL